MIQAFCNWLSNTALSMVIQNTSWIIPTVQTVHILAISIVMASILMLDLRLLGAFARTQSVVAMSERFVPWVWVAVLVLAASGALLIVGEPGRELQSQVFWVKMALLVGALAVTAVFRRAARRTPGFWEQHRGAAYAVAVTSLALWTAIVAAGRWIAYWEHG